MNKPETKETGDFREPGRTTTVPAFAPSAESGPAAAGMAPKAARWREEYVSLLLRIASLLGAMLVIFSIPVASLGTRIFFIVVYALLAGITLLRTPHRLRTFSLLTLTYMAGVYGLYLHGPFTMAGIYLLSGLIIATLFMDTKADILGLAIIIVTILIFTVLNQIYRVRPAAASVPQPALADWVFFATHFLFLSLILIFAIRRQKMESERILHEAQAAYQSLLVENKGLQELARERSERLEGKSLQSKAILAIARAAAASEQVPELLNLVVNRTAESFGFDLVGFYLLDEERKNIFLQAVSSAAGQPLLGRSQKVEGDSQDPVVQVVVRGLAWMATDAASGVFLEDPNFPETKSRMILPLVLRDRVIGVLDIHSHRVQAFSPEDLDAIQPLADLTAQLIEIRRLALEAQGLSQQLQTLTITQTRDIWSAFTSRNIPGYQYTPAGIRPVFNINPREPGERELRLPLLLHGERIGTIKLQRKGREGNWSERERELVEKITDQIALALENSRLVEEAQRNAQRDTLIANISTRVRETLDVDSVIRTAATEFRKVFDLKEVEISVGSPDSAPVRVRRNTSSLRNK